MEHAILMPAAPFLGGPAKPRLARAGLVSMGSAGAGMPNQDELNEWMRAVAAASDRPAFAALFRYFAPRVKGYLMRGGCAEPLADELTQETMVSVWRRAASFDPSRARLSTWIFTIARNLRIDQLRRGGSRSSPVEDCLDADQMSADLELAPDVQAQAAQRESNVRAALAGLPADQVQVLMLSYFEEQPHARIAEQLQIPLGTVKSRIRLAVTQLRRRLEELES
jgi:RNA polymerase sigma factor (sigma-70 family)